LQRPARATWIISIAAAATWGCVGGGRSGPTAPAPVPLAQSEAITIESIAPPTGSMLELDACPEVHPSGLCTDRLQVTFSVLPDRDLAQARISVTFYEGDLRGRQCALASSEARDLSAGTRVAMHLSRVEMILAGDGPVRAPACAVPATTHLMRATLVQDPDQRSHSRDFGYVYTFARP
jgi:hypothetical protein